MTKKINNPKISCNALVAPLDWGLGHATRCIPIITSLQQKGFKVYVAAEGKSKILLENELPGINFLTLSGYHINYSKGKKNFKLKLLVQIPKILKAIKRENKWLKQVIKKYNIKIVLSDNRFGLHNSAIYSIFITHQLHIETGNKFINAFAQKINYSYIKKFNECWVPDFDTEPTLAGKLAHPRNLPAIPVKYIGPLSRLKQKETEKIYDIVIMLSGPEPQRTILEDIFFNEILPGISRKIIFIRGLPENLEPKQNTENIIFYNHLKGEKLSEILCSATQVICRGGYSTVMDLVSLKVPALLIATPGQNEQEYLAEHLNKIGLFQSVEQDVLAIKNAMNRKVQKTIYPKTDGRMLKIAVEALHLTFSK